MKKIAFSILTMVIVFSILSVAFAESIVPYADSVFASAYISLSTSKSATFKSKVYEQTAILSITSCWLQKKTSSGAWVSTKSLIPPDHVSNDAYTYGAVKDYSDDIGTGTFRIKATFNADGYTITRYSNERSF